MTPERAPTFNCKYFDHMMPGSVDLSVPLRHDAIQIGAIGDVIAGRIQITKESQSITVMRSDGLPIQAEIVTDISSGVEPLESILRTRIFEEPVPDLQFRISRDLGDAACWYLCGENIGVPSMSNLATLARTIGMFAVRKQYKIIEDKR